MSIQWRMTNEPPYAGLTPDLILNAIDSTGLRTDGNVHPHQLKSLDWKARQARLVERAPPQIITQVLNCLLAVFEE